MQSEKFVGEDDKGSSEKKIPIDKINIAVAVVEIKGR